MEPQLLKSYKLSELLEMSHIQTLADSNYRASGLPMTIIDSSDNRILVKAGWPGMCCNYHRVNPLTAMRCHESDNYVVGRIGEGESFQYKCLNGLWHIAVPIVVMGRHLGTLFLTQFFFEAESLDQEYFIAQAREFGFDRDGYLAALHLLPKFGTEKVEYILAYYKAMARFLADMAEQSVQVIETKKILSESEEKYRTLVNNIKIGVFRHSSGRLIQANPAMAHIFGFDSVDSLMDADVTSLFLDPRDKSDLIEETKRSGFVKNAAIAMRKLDGTPIWCSFTVNAQFDIEDGGIKWIDGAIEDITERKRMQDELREHSEKDHLTGIYNRRKLSELLAAELRKARRYDRALSLIMFDLDHFKKVNDNHGHDIGDIVLKKTAEIVSAGIRSTDLFARYGGEEFVILCTETDVAGAATLAEKIRSCLEQHRYPVVGNITISAGVAGFSKDMESEESFIKCADEALYAAKRNGRNRVESNPVAKPRDGT